MTWGCFRLIFQVLVFTRTPIIYFCSLCNVPSKSECSYNMDCWHHGLQFLVLTPLKVLGCQNQLRRYEVRSLTPACEKFHQQYFLHLLSLSANTRLDILIRTRVKCHWTRGLPFIYSWLLVVSADVTAGVSALSWLRSDPLMISKC